MKQFKTRRPVPTVPTELVEIADSGNRVLPEVEEPFVPTVPTVPGKVHIRIENGEPKNIIHEAQTPNEKNIISDHVLIGGIYTFVGTPGTVGTVDVPHTCKGDDYTQEAVGTNTGNSGNKWEQQVGATVRHLLSPDVEEWRYDDVQTYPPAWLNEKRHERNAPGEQLRMVAGQMHEQHIGGKDKYRMAIWVGYTSYEAAIIAKMVKTGEWYQATDAAEISL